MFGFLGRGLTLRQGHIGIYIYIFIGFLAQSKEEPSGKEHGKCNENWCSLHT